METLSDLIWEDEDEDVDKAYGIPLQGTLCIVLCTIVTAGGICTSDPPLYQTTTNVGVSCGC